MKKSGDNVFQDIRNLPYLFDRNMAEIISLAAGWTSFIYRMGHLSHGV